MAEVEDLLQEQSMTNLNLELLSENKETFENILAEVQLSNMLMEENASSIHSLEKKIEESFFMLGEFLAQSLVIQKENQVILSEGPTTGNEISTFNDTVNKNGSSIFDLAFKGLRQDVSFDEEGNVQRGELTGADKITEDKLSGINDNGEQALLRLINIDRGIDKIVNSQAELSNAQEISDLEDKAQASSSFVEPKKAKGRGVFDGLFSKVPAGLLKVGKFGLYGALIAGTGLMVKGIFDTLDDEKLLEDITGKSIDDLSATDQGLAVISHGIEKLTFGLVKAGDAFSLVEPISGLLQDGIDRLFDPDTGLFAEFTMGFMKLVDGDYKMAFDSVMLGLKALPEALLNFSASIGNAIFDSLPEDFSSVIKEKMDEGFVFLFDIPTKIGESFEKLMNLTFSDILELSGKATDSLKANIPKTIHDSLDYIFSLPEKIGEFVGNFASDLASGIAEDVSTIAKTLPFGLGDKISELASSLVDQDRTESGARRTGGIFKPVIAKSAGDGVPVARSPNNINSSETTALSKQRLDAQNVTVEAPQPQTIVVHAPAREKQSLERRTDSTDVKLAMQNQGM